VKCLGGGPGRPRGFRRDLKANALVARSGVSLLPLL
jgi:hypothetical protein